MKHALKSTVYCLMILALGCAKKTEPLIQDQGKEPTPAAKATCTATIVIDDTTTIQYEATSISIFSFDINIDNENSNIDINIDLRPYQNYDALFEGEEIVLSKDGPGEATVYVPYEDYANIDKSYDATSGKVKITSLKEEESEVGVGKTTIFSGTFEFEADFDGKSTMTVKGSFENLRKTDV